MLLTNIGALQGLYVALGGKLSDVANITTIPEMLQAISTVAASAAGELPAVAAGDIGDVLTVVSDGKGGAAWGKGEIPSELPTVSGDDNGKILAVAEGDWALGTLSASADLETGAVTFTFTPDV